MATYKIELNNRSIKGSKEHSLLLRITVDKTHARMKLIYSVNPDQFNRKTKNGLYIKTSHPNHVKINRYLSRVIQDAKEAEEEIEKRKDFISASSIKNELTKPNSSSIYTFMDQHISQLEVRGAIGTYKKYKVILKVLKDFSKKDELKFGNINSQFLNDLQSRLISEGKSLTTVHGYLSKIRSVFNKAIAEGVIQSHENPFTTYRIKQGQTTKERLTIDEIKKIENLDLSGKGKINDVKNIWLFSFYNAGMRIADALLLRWKNINGNIVTYQMHKTGKLHELEIMEKARQILENYKDPSKESFIFPFMNPRFDLKNPSLLHNQIGAKTAIINRYLKKIAIMAEIEKKITTHTARHSFADLARKKEIDLYTISKMLGHGDIKVTQAYLASFDSEIISKGMKKMFD